MSDHPYVLIERHGVAEILVRVGDPAAVEANELRVFRELFNFLEHVLCRKDTKMTCVVTCTDIVFFHGVLLLVLKPGTIDVSVCYYRSRDASILQATVCYTVHLPHHSRAF
jgi:hypothetical protein